MSHEIYQERVLANDGRPMWHRLGKVREAVQTFSQALNEILNGAYYAIEPAGIHTVDGWKLLPGQRAVVMHDPNNEEPSERLKSFGIVSNQFSIITPTRLAEMLDPILTQAGYQVATAGMLRGGSSIFISMEIGSRDVVGERHTDYLTFDLSFEPGRSMQVYLTTVRTVCANTQAIGIENASINCTVSHTGDVDGKMLLAADFIANIDERKERFTQLMEAFTRYRVNDEEIAALLETVHYMPKRPKNLSGFLDKMTPEEIAHWSTENDAVSDLIEDFSKQERAYMNACARAEDRRELVMLASEKFASDFPHFKGTAYQWYNAVTETSDWRDGRGNIAASVAGGDRQNEKIRGARFLTELVG